MAQADTHMYAEAKTRVRVAGAQQPAGVCRAARAVRGEAPRAGGCAAQGQSADSCQRVAGAGYWPGKKLLSGPFEAFRYSCCPAKHTMLYAGLVAAALAQQQCRHCASGPTRAC